jgi:hypothetical protein
MPEPAEVNVYREWGYGGMHHYVVWVDGEAYDNFTVTKGGRLTHSQLIDVASYYRQGLTTN